MGNNITMNAYLYSAVVAGNGYEVDFFIPNHPSQNEHPINPGIIWDRSSNNFGWISVDQYC
jgi:hypothetical protein